MVDLIESKFSSVFFLGDEPCTRNYSPGEHVYGEALRTIDGVEYRMWNPRRSKLAALILNHCSVMPIKPNSKVLYLGAGNGTTASHVSDIATKGTLYCVEFSSRAFRDLLEVSKSRKNMFPILESAFYPERYKTLVGPVDVIYQDVSQRDQAQAFIANAKQFLNKSGFGIFMIKSRSIDMTRAPESVFKEVIKHLKSSGFQIIDRIRLEPYTKDHLGLILKN
jgi:fibrillarin-like pre-rRNA processing protein